MRFVWNVLFRKKEQVKEKGREENRVEKSNNGMQKLKNKRRLVKLSV